MWLYLRLSFMAQEEEEEGGGGGDYGWARNEAGQLTVFDCCMQV